MMFGITPITNLSSNLGDYLNSSNSIIIRGNQVNDVIKALELSIKDIKNNGARRANAEKTAKDYFYIERYENELFSLLNIQK